MQEIFFENASHYHLSNNDEFVQLRMRSIGNGTERVRLQVHNYGKYYRKQYETLNSLLSLKQI